MSTQHPSDEEGLMFEYVQYALDLLVWENMLAQQLDMVRKRRLALIRRSYGTDCLRIAKTIHDRKRG